jgi:hypothetical protein
VGTVDFDYWASVQFTRGERVRERNQGRESDRERNQGRESEREKPGERE